MTCPMCATMLENAPPPGEPVFCRRHEGEIVRALRRLVKAIDVYDAALTVTALQKGDLGFDEYVNALYEARRLVEVTSTVSFAREQEGVSNGVPWCHRCPDGECRGELKLSSCDIRTVVVLGREVSR